MGNYKSKILPHNECEKIDEKCNENGDCYFIMETKCGYRFMEENNNDNNIKYSIALTEPYSLKCMHIDSDYKIWSLMGNINNWISEKITTNKFTNWIVYNDSVLNANKNYGIAKGILIWDENTISYMIHSIPNFPSYFNKNIISPLPHNMFTSKRGNIFIFIDNIPIRNLKFFFNQLNTLNVNVINSNYKYDLKFYSLISEFYITNEICHIAKNKKWKYNLYDKYIKPFIKNDTCIEIEDYIEWSYTITTPYTIKYSKKLNNGKWYLTNNGYLIILDVDKELKYQTKGSGALIIKNRDIYEMFKSLLK